MCRKPCGECPYTKNSAPGYFCGHKMKVYENYIIGDNIVACHTRSKFDDSLKLSIIPCYGHILAQIKSCKVPTNPDLVRLHSDIISLKKYGYLLANSLSKVDFAKHHEKNNGFN